MPSQRVILRRKGAGTADTPVAAPVTTAATAAPKRTVVAEGRHFVRLFPALPAPARAVSLTPLPQFLGEDVEDDEYDGWSNPRGRF